MSRGHQGEQSWLLEANQLCLESSGKIGPGVWNLEAAAETSNWNDGTEA
jgi:hypothetical protein